MPQNDITAQSLRGGITSLYPVKNPLNAPLEFLTGFTKML